MIDLAFRLSLFLVGVLGVIGLIFACFLRWKAYRDYRQIISEHDKWIDEWKKAHGDLCKTGDGGDDHP